MDWGHLLFGFDGRINRAKIWLWLLIWIIAWIVVAIIAGILLAVTGSLAIMLILYAIMSIAGVVSYVAAIIKRLHDRGKSAWWVLIFVVLPGVLVGASMGATLTTIIASGGQLEEMSPVGSILGLVGSAISLWAFVELWCLRGTIGSNQYGPDPLEGKI
jgi:uncharacterized membrane protein YhaH (DUF805 family)